MRFSTIVRLTSAAFALIAIVLLSIGISTLYWPKTKATIETSESERITLHGYNSRHVTNSTDLDLQVARYTYSVNGIEYKNSQICFCLPLGWKNQEQIGDNATVSYLSARPEWSVLRPGPDLLAVLILLSAALLIYLGEESLLKVLGIDS